MCLPIYLTGANHKQTELLGTLQVYIIPLADGMYILYTPYIGFIRVCGPSMQLHTQEFNVDTNKYSLYPWGPWHVTLPSCWYPNMSVPL